MIQQNHFLKVIIFVTSLFFFFSSVSFHQAFCQGKEIQAYVFNHHALLLLTLPNGETNEMVKLQDNEFITTLEFSPNQDEFCMITGSKKYESTHLYLVNVRTMEKKLILKIESDSWIARPFWSPDSKKLVVLVGYKEIESADFTHYEHYWLKQYDLTTDQLVDIVKVNEPVNSISWSMDSSYLAFNGKEENVFSLYILDIGQNKLSKPQQNLFSDWVFKNLNFWSLQGDILFLVNGTTLSSYDAKNKRYQQIKDLHKQIITQQWNHNLNQVALLTKEGEETILETLNFDNGSMNVIEKGFQIDSPRFSLDGEKVSYFLKRKDQPYSTIIVFDTVHNKLITTGDAGLISIYPWDVDPTYSVWSNRSDSLIYVTNKENQNQFLSRLSLVDQQLTSVSSAWEYIYQYGYSRADDWIYVSGTRSEKEFIEFISNENLSQKIERQDMKFCEWKLDGDKDGAGHLDSKNTSNKNLSILLIAALGVFFLVLLIFLLSRRNRKS